MEAPPVHGSQDLQIQGWKVARTGSPESSRAHWKEQGRNYFHPLAPRPTSSTCGAAVGLRSIAHPAGGSMSWRGDTSKLAPYLCISLLCQDEASSGADWWGSGCRTHMPSIVPSLLPKESLGLQVFAEGSLTLGRWSWLRPVGRKDRPSPPPVQSVWEQTPETI